MDKATFLKEFGPTASAPSGVKKLREMIGEMAIRGSLSHRSSDDACVLVQNLVAQKNILIAEKKIKKSKPLPSVKADEAPFLLPSSWCWVRLKDIGYNLGQKKPESNFHYIDVASIDNQKGITSNDVEVLIPSKAPSRARKIVKYGTVLYSTVRPYLLNTAVITKNYHPSAIASTAFAVIHPFQGINPHFVHIFLRSTTFRNYVESQMKGVAYPAINDEKFFRGLFPLPPKCEQDQIVAKYNELSELCDQLEAQQQRRQQLCTLTREAALDALANASGALELESAWERVKGGFRLLFDTPSSVGELRNIVKSLAAHGFLSLDSVKTASSTENLFNIPESWEWTTVGELSEYITSGSRGWKKYYAEQGDTFIRSQDIKLDRLHFADRAYVDLPEKVEGQRTRVQTGDILITITGGNVGKCAQVPELQETAYVSQHVSLIRLKNTKNAAYLHMWLTNSFGGRSHLLSEAYGDKPGLNLKQIASVPVPLPPQDIQEQILAKFNSLNDLCTQFETQLQSLRHKQELLAETACAAMVA